MHMYARPITDHNINNVILILDWVFRETVPSNEIAGIYLAPHLRLRTWELAW